jgi:flagellar biosynthesis/type III secretory pathway chaperone
MQRPDLIPVVDTLIVELSLLGELFNEEFGALKRQDIDLIETLQTKKEALLEQLADERVAQALQTITADENPDPQLLERWHVLQEICRLNIDAQKKNEILITRKLLVLREAIQAIRRPSGQESVQLYNRLGKLGPARG